MTCPSCGKRASYRCCIGKHLLSTVGAMHVTRRYYACRRCAAKQVPWDAWAGVGNRQMTEHVRKMITIVGSSWSFDVASARLRDLCHIPVSDDTRSAACATRRASGRGGG